MGINLSDPNKHMQQMTVAEKTRKDTLKVQNQSLKRLQDLMKCQSAFDYEYV